MHNYPIKHNERAEIELQIEQFLASGKSIDEVSSDVRGQKTDALKERSDASRAAQLVIDKNKLKSFHKEGLYKHIKYVKKSRINEEGFRVCNNGVNLGVRALLDDALLIKTTP